MLLLKCGAALRALYILLFTFCVLVVVFTIAGGKFALPPEPVAVDFVKAVKSGDASHAVDFFGDVTCSCPPKGGYISYFNYESGHDPNLTFLLGHPFETGPVTASELRKTYPNTLPWEHPVTYVVHVPLTFNPSRYSPFLLPLPMAFGKEMDLRSFEQFVSNPDVDKTKILSLRLRPTVAPGLIKPHQNSPDDITSLVSVPYLYPTDPGRVVAPNGSSLSRSQIESKLPHLTSIVLALTMQRKGTTTPWLVARVQLTNAVVQVDGQKPVPLTDLLPPPTAKGS